MGRRNRGGQGEGEGEEGDGSTQHGDSGRRVGNRIIAMASFRRAGMWAGQSPPGGQVAGALRRRPAPGFRRG